MRESKIEKAVKSWAKAHDILPIKNTPMGSGGWPDDYFLYYWPKIAIIEFKAPGEQPKPRQELRIAELRRRGFPAEVIDDIQQGIAFLESSLLSGDRGNPGSEPSVRGVPSTPRHGQDDDHLRDSEHPVKEEAYP